MDNIMDMYRENLEESISRGEICDQFREHMEVCDPPLSPQEEEMYIDNITLPYEILIKIFALLSVRSRDAVKLSCRYFKDICDRISCNKEKLVFPENASHTTIIDILELSKSTSINLVLYGHNFEKIPRKVWTRFGPKIRSIELYFCDFGVECLHRLFKFCIDLESIVICDDRRKDRRTENIEQPDIVDRFGELDLYGNGTTAQSFIDGLDYYLLFGLSHSRVKNFTIRAERPLIKENFILEKIYEIFPGVEQIHFDGQCTSVC